MPFAAGVFSLVSGNPVVTGTTISSTWANNTLDDIASNGLSLCVLKDGSQTITANIPMGGFKLTGLAAGSATGNSLRYEQLFTTSAVTLLGAMDWVKGADIASASTINLTTATGNAVHVTGAVTITAVTLGSGMWRLVIFDGVLTLTHHSTNNNLPGGANITTAAGDRALYWSDGTTVYCVNYIHAGSVPIMYATQSQMQAASSTSVAVSPGILKQSPNVPKVGCQVDQSSGTATLIAGSFGVTSITDGATGIFTVNFSTNFADTNYIFIGSSGQSNIKLNTPTKNVGSVVINVETISTGVLIDKADNNLVIWGGQ